MAVTAACCPLAAGRAQDAVLLRLNPAAGQVTRFRAVMDAWLRSPLFAGADTIQPTAHVTSYITRIVTTAPDSQRIELTDHTDSSTFDFPALRGFMPAAGTGDLLRGMRTMTRLDSRARGVATMVVEAPNLPTGMPALIRGVQGLTVAISRLASVSLPEQPVRPGDTWTDTLTFDLANVPGLTGVGVQGTGSGLATMRFERVEQRYGARIAVLTAVATANAGAADETQSATLNLSATSTVDLDLDAGRFVRSQTLLAGPLVTRLGVIPVRVRMTIQAL